jgi:sugar-specific transcriptional regulator TrmB
MAINEERLAKIQEYGLTEYEARAYLALLDFEVATASKVARLARVPRTKIYQALEDLEEKQLVQVIPERPKRFVAQPFENHIEQLEREHERKIQQLEQEREDLADEFQPKGTVNLEDPGQFVMVRSRSNVTEKIMSLIEGAEESVLLVGSEMTLARFDYFSPSIEEAAEEGVMFTAMGPLTEENEDAVEELSEHGRVLSYADATPGQCLLIVDGEEVMLTHAVPDDTHLFQGEDVAMWTDDQAMVASFQSIAEIALSAAQPLEAEQAPEAETEAAVAAS